MWSVEGGYGATVGETRPEEPGVLIVPTEHAFMIWFRSANSHTGPQLYRCIRGRTDGSIRLSANLLQKPLALGGRPQMSTPLHRRREFRRDNNFHFWLAH